MSLYSVIKNSIPSLTRSVYISEEGDVSRDSSQAESRRLHRTDGERFARHSAVYAAIRRRSNAFTAPKIFLNQKLGSNSMIDEATTIGVVGDIGVHPILDILTQVNDTFTFTQAWSLLEEDKCIFGEAAWVVHRRSRSKIPKEFEILDPRFFEPILDKNKSWKIVGFRYFDPIKGPREFGKKDVVYFRHIVDPRNRIRGLSPISAIRVTVDTDLEAKRYNQKFFDQGGEFGQVISAPGIGPAERQRLDKDITSKHMGTDNSHKPLIIESDVKVVSRKMSQKDMQFVDQERWTVEDVARVFEISPTLLGDLTNGADVRTEQSLREFWAMMRYQIETTIEEFNEFFIIPNFGSEFYLEADFSNIPFLQRDAKLQAEIDEIYLRNAKVTVNELRIRDKQGETEWGDVPIVSQGLRPLFIDGEFVNMPQEPVNGAPPIEAQEEQTVDPDEDKNNDMLGIQY